MTLVDGRNAHMSRCKNKSKKKGNKKHSKVTQTHEVKKEVRRDCEGRKKRERERENLSQVKNGTVSHFLLSRHSDILTYRNNADEDMHHTTWTP